MTIHRTFRPRGTLSSCAVCKAVVSTRGRSDWLGQVMCSRHGLQAWRYAERKLLDHEPRLAFLLRQRVDLSWIHSCLHPDIYSKVVRFPCRSTAEMPMLLPYHRAAPRKCQPRRTKKRRRIAAEQCEQCGSAFTAGEGRKHIRRWGDADLCRACHARLLRQHERAVRQFQQLVAYVRNGGHWLVPKLQPILSQRITQYLARTASRRMKSVLDPDRYV